ncbi:MAG: nucleotidyltransferase domain-containing protein [Oligoflexia bacterium]|nr:nucleotidyltransferase domain-containing protein [Oligoflexia bacterium]
MPRTRDQAIKIARKYAKFVNQFIAVEACYLFGSFAREDQKIHQYSDIDVAVVSKDFEDIPVDIAVKMLFRATKVISTLIEPEAIPPLELKDPEIGAIGCTISRHDIKL